MARAICDLESTSRWAVTGTPIQNNLSDLSALLKFVRAFPYDDPKRFTMDISLLWKSGEDEEAVKRLKHLSRSRDKNNWADNAQEAFNIQRHMEAMKCSQCSSSLDVSESLGDENTAQDTAHFFECLKYACAECIYNHRISNTVMSCGHKPACSIAPVSVSNSALEEVFRNVSEGSKITHPIREVPSKVKALISDLEKQPKDVKRYVSN
ncbi:unnamed protein product [Alternaria alternata]